MSRFLKIMARELVLRLPGLRENYFDYEFSRRPQSFRGVYASFADALADAPADKQPGYDHEELAAATEPNLDTLHPADYAVLFWLSRFLPGAQGVLDLGGNLGVAWYIYRRFLDFPLHLRWTVWEVSQMARAGRELARKRGEMQLDFIDQAADAPEPDIFFSAGALQYIEEPLAEILEGLPYLPRHILIQRVPLQDGAPFVTLQNNGPWVMPYKVGNENALIESVSGLGYTLVDRWNTPRKLQVLAHPLTRGAVYQGMYFRLEE